MRNLLSDLKQKFTQYAIAKNELEELKLQQAAADKEADYNKFLAEEFSELDA
jgi:DNA repair ATPase RecN